MSPSSVISFATLLAFASLAPYSFAQDISNNGTGICPFSWLPDINTNTPVNATGNVTFRWQNEPRNTQDWYFSVAINFTSNDTFNAEQGAPYISVPENTTDQVCVHKFGALNITATGTGQNGCEGVLSDKCLEYLRSFRGPVIGPGVTGRIQCSNNVDFDELEEACGKPLREEGKIGSPRALDLANSTCAIQSPPGVEVPDGYRSFSIGSGSILPTGYRRFDKNDLYDLYTRQTRVWAITGSFREQQSETVVVCIAPDNIVQGSRVPEGEWPPQGSSTAPAGDEDEDDSEDNDSNNDNDQNNDQNNNENVGVAMDTQAGSWLAMAAAGSLAFMLV